MQPWTSEQRATALWSAAWIIGTVLLVVIGSLAFHLDWSR